MSATSKSSMFWHQKCTVLCSPIHWCITATESISDSHEHMFSDAALEHKWLAHRFWFDFFCALHNFVLCSLHLFYVFRPALLKHTDKAIAVLDATILKYLFTGAVSYEFSLNGINMAHVSVSMFDQVKCARRSQSSGRFINILEVNELCIPSSLELGYSGNKQCCSFQVSSCSC